MLNESKNTGRWQRLRWVLAVALCALAVAAVWQRVWSTGNEEISPYAVRPETLRNMVCDACGAAMKMTVSDFDKARKDAHPETHMLKCPNCGEPRLWRAPTGRRALGNFKASKEQIDGAIGEGDDAYAPMKPNISVNRKRKNSSQ